MPASNQIAKTPEDQAPPPALSTDPLFRSEVLIEQQSHWLGTVLLSPRITYLAFATFAILVVAGLVGLLAFADYARKARVNGWLVPESGLMRIFAPQAGVVVQLNVQEGDTVSEGTPLALLSSETETAAYGATRQEIVLRLLSRIDSLMAEREQQQLLQSQQLAHLRNQLATTEAELLQIDSELDVLRQRLALAESEVARQRDLRARGLVTEEPLVEAQQDRLDQALRLQSLERDRIVIDRERLRLDAEIEQSPVLLATLLEGIDRQVSTLEQELAEVESRRETVILAPQDGTVTSIGATAGSSVGADTPLLSLVPAGAQLEAELFSPSSAIGFVRPGQQVLLRYDAFPYQRFGSHAGVVTDISPSAVSPTDLPQQLAWVPTVYGTTEPLYRITVRPATQTVAAYGTDAPLQPGMRLEADIVIEERRLLDWVLDPLYALTGR